MTCDPIRYIAWVETTFPSGGGKGGRLFPVLERATRALHGLERYRNSPDYMKMWIQYVRGGLLVRDDHVVLSNDGMLVAPHHHQADLLDDPAEVFAYLYRSRIGEDLALFYLAWALVAERQNRFAFADRVYGKGLDRCVVAALLGTVVL